MPADVAKAPDGPPAPRRARELRDFSDRLPAVLVKELRQGLRGKMFVAGFCTLHALLVMTGMESQAGATRFFWFCLSVMFVFLLPSRNLSALGEERQEKTLDTLILTRLTPWRIVWGKWSATTALALLTAISLLPYVLVRYLHGGGQVLSESIVLFALVLCCCGLSAIYTAVSIIRSPLARNAIAVVAALLVYYLAAQPWIESLSGSKGPPLDGVVSFTIMAVWLTLFSLWQAAESIAPLTANVAAPRRLVTLAAFLLCLAAGLLDSRHGGNALFTAAAVILVASGLVELGAKPPPAHIPFVWRGRFRTAAALFLSPGWASGFCFVAVMLGIWALLPYHVIRVECTPTSLFSILAAPLILRLLLPASQRWGAAPMFAIAAGLHFSGEILAKFFASEASVIAALCPGFQDTAKDPHIAGAVALVLLAGVLPMLLPAIRTIMRRAAPVQ